MKASPQLLAAVERLYEVFAAYPLPRYTDPCLCCHKVGDEAFLHTKPLRNLERESLQIYAMDAILVWGNESTFKHFLPRLIELFIVQHEAYSYHVDPAILLSKFKHGNWQTWPLTEQKAVKNFLHEFWVFVLNAMPGPNDEKDDIEALLCAIAQAEDDLTPYLEQWMESGTLEAHLALSGLLLQSAVVLDSNAGRNQFWNGRDQQYRQLTQWVRSQAVTMKIEKAVDRWAETEYGAEFLAARAIVT